MDFSLPPEIEDLAQRARAFVAGEIMPVEADRASWDEHENIRLDRLETLRARAKAAGLWSPQTPQERGGMGLPRVAMAACTRRPTARSSARWCSTPRHPTTAT